METAQNGIIQSAEQPTGDLHKNIREPLGQLGHSSSTVPPSEMPVVGEDLRDLVEDLTYNATSGLEQAVTGGVTNIRVTKSKKPRSIAAVRQALINKIKGKFKKAA